MDAGGKRKRVNEKERERVCVYVIDRESVCVTERERYSVKARLPL